MRIFKKPLLFDWDNGNINKNLKHGITDKEAEECFFDTKKRTFKDKLHSKGEERFRVIGKTKKGRLLFIAFTIRNERIRTISARDINKKEVKLYEEKT